MTTTRWRSLSMTMLALVITLAAVPAKADSLSSVVVNLQESTADLVRVDMKVTTGRDGRAAPVTISPVPACEQQGKAVAERRNKTVLRSWTLKCKGGLGGRDLLINGLSLATSDALVTIRRADGAIQHASLSRHQPQIHIEANTASVSAKSGNASLLPYFDIGMQHILAGFDHLLFVLALLLLLRLAGSTWKTIVAAVTAFTVAHSITLAGVTLAGWSLPSAPVEAVIALSILLLAAEIIDLPHRQARGWPPTLTVRSPWLVAFLFGLLHGFGFAGALAEIGVPEQARGWALLLFNLGVEAGQLLFIAIVAALMTAARWIVKQPNTTSIAWSLAAHVIGAMSAFWLIERSVGLLA